MDPLQQALGGVPNPFQKAQQPLLQTAPAMQPAPASNPFQGGGQPQPAQAQSTPQPGPSSVPSASPNPPAPMPAGTPGEGSGGAIPPQPGAPQGATASLPAGANPEGDVDLDQLLAQSQEQGQVQPEGEPDLDALLQQSQADAQKQPPDQFGHIHNYFAGFNAGLIHALNAPSEFVQKGIDLLTGEKNPVDGVQMLKDLGFNEKTFDTGSMSAKIGVNTADAMFSFAAMEAAAPSLAAQTGTSSLALLGKGLGQALQDHPWMQLVSDVIGGVPGSTVGEEKAGPTGALIGGVVGNLVTAPAQLALRLGVKGVKNIAGSVANWVDKIAAKVGSNNEPIAALGQKAVEPIVPDEILDTYRSTEARARAAGESTVQAATAYRQAIPGTPQHAEAAQALSEAKLAEATAAKQADDAFNAIPAQVRGKYSQEAEAIRAQFADTVYPKVFAEEQVQGDRQLVTDKIKASLQQVQPEDRGVPSAAYAERVSQGLQDAEKLASGIEGKYWERVDILKEQMPSRRNVNEGLNDYSDEMQAKFAPEDVPQDRVRGMYQLFAAKDANGDPNPLPTVQRVRGEIAAMRQERTAQINSEAPNYRMIANLTKLEVMANKWIGDAFPDNVPLSQARAFSATYHDMFSRSAIFPFLKQGARGQDVIRPEDTLTKLLASPHAIEDIYSMVDRLLAHPNFSITLRDLGERAMPVPPATLTEKLQGMRPAGMSDALARQWGGQEPQLPNQPMPGVRNAARTGPMQPMNRDSLYGGQAQNPKMLTPEEAGTLTELKSNIENGVKQTFQEAVQASLASTDSKGNPMDPAVTAAKMQQLLKTWEPRIKAFGDTAGELVSAMDQAMTGVQQRRAIEGSALSKYFESNDATTAINRIWSSSNPAAVAKAVMNGEAGIGGFRTDPIALEGFRAAITDKLFDQAQRDPFRVAQLLNDGRISRLLDTTLGADRSERLRRLVAVSVQVEKQAQHSTWGEVKMWAGRIAAVRLSALMPKFGEGGEIQQASMFSEAAKKIISNYGKKVDPVQLLSEAVRNPSLERQMFSKVPETTKEAAANMLLARRVLRADVGIRGAYEAYQKEGKGPGPIDHRQPLSLMDFNPIGSANAMDLTNLPPSSRIEDRRGYQGPIEGSLGEMLKSGNPSQGIQRNQTIVNVNRSARQANDRVENGGDIPDFHGNGIPEWSKSNPFMGR
jgi:hypothetical protein